METGRAMLLQILSNADSQAVQFTMRSHRSLNSQQFASAKPVIDICQRKRVVHVSSKAAGRRRKAEENASIQRHRRNMSLRHHMLIDPCFLHSYWVWGYSFHPFVFLFSSCVVIPTITIIHCTINSNTNSSSIWSSVFPHARRVFPDVSNYHSDPSQLK